MRYEKLYDACLHLAFLMRQQAIISDIDFKQMINDLLTEFKSNQEEIKKLEERINNLELTRGYN